MHSVISLESSLHRNENLSPIRRSSQRHRYQIALCFPAIFRGPVHGNQFEDFLEKNVICPWCLLCSQKIGPANPWPATHSITVNSCKGLVPRLP